MMYNPQLAISQAALRKNGKRKGIALSNFRSLSLPLLPFSLPGFHFSLPVVALPCRATSKSPMHQKTIRHSKAGPWMDGRTKIAIHSLSRDRCPVGWGLTHGRRQSQLQFERLKVVLRRRHSWRKPHRVRAVPRSSALLADKAGTAGGNLAETVVPLALIQPTKYRVVRVNGSAACSIAKNRRAGTKSLPRIIPCCHLALSRPKPNINTKVMGWMQRTGHVVSCVYSQTPAAL